MQKLLNGRLYYAGASCPCFIQLQRVLLLMRNRIVECSASACTILDSNVTPFSAQERQ